jgi:glycosyltransferase involved in cell wall biosynthesis
MNVGGTATYLFNLINGLIENGVESLLAVGVVPDYEIEDNRLSKLPFKRIPQMSRELSIIGDFRARGEIWDLINNYKPDLIHTHTFKAGLLVRTKKTDIPIVHTFHGHHLYDPDYGLVKKRILNFIERKLADNSTRIVTIGTKVGLELLELGIGDKCKYVSIPPGVQVIKRKDRQKSIQKFQLSPNYKNVLWMGRLTQVKRPDRVNVIAKVFPDVNFIVAGDGELRSNLKDDAPSNVVFLGVQNADEMFSIADVVLLTSDSEGMPLTLIEGQMAGLPAVGTNVGSVSEIIINGKTGFVTSTQTDDICRALNKLLNNSILRNTMSREAAKYAQNEFSINRMVDSHMDIYREVLK